MVSSKRKAPSRKCKRKFKKSILRKKRLPSKFKIGCGSILFKKAIKNAQKLLNKFKPNNIDGAIKIANKAIKSVIKKRKMNPSGFRTIPLPKVGGFLPLVSVLTALGAVGGLASSGSAVVRAVNEIKAAKEQLKEAKRHNETMESIAIGGRGVFLKPYKSGYGLYYRPHTIHSKN